MLRKRRTAHRFDEKRRTTDVLINENVDFSGLMLSRHVLEGLKSAGFEKPSPIQLEAIPRGRCGLDMIAQAKSGTGKTCVFSVIALESINLDVELTQVLVLAPTREIAVQIKDVISSIGQHFNGLQTHEFIGGLPVEGDKNRLKKCHIAIGTPGRIKHLIESKLLQTMSIRLFILDEADKLLDESFQEQINWIYSTLPASKQVLALSATYPDYLAKQLKNYMKDPQYVRLNAVDPALEGICHYSCVVPSHQLPHKVFDEKVKRLQQLLAKLSFNQCLIFSNYHVRAKALSEILTKKGWPSTYISGGQAQIERLNAMAKLKDFQCRILISTDLTSRGIDAERVNLVINMDLPHDSETYLHRVGRAGRFGSYGVAVNFVGEGEELENLKKIEVSCGVMITTLPDDFSKLLFKEMMQENSKKCEVISVTKLKSGSVVDEILGNDETKILQTGELCKRKSENGEKVDDKIVESSIVEKDDEIDQKKTSENVVTNTKVGTECLSTTNRVESNKDDVKLKRLEEKMLENTGMIKVMASEDLSAEYREHWKNVEDEGITNRNVEKVRKFEYGDMVVNSTEDRNNVDDKGKIKREESTMNDTVKEKFTDQSLVVIESEVEDKIKVDPLCDEEDVIEQEKIIEREKIIEQEKIIEKNKIIEKDKIIEPENVQERRVVEFEYTDIREDNTKSEQCLSHETGKNFDVKYTNSSSDESTDSSESASTDESHDSVIFRKSEYEFSSSEETESYDSQVPISCKDFENVLETHVKDSVGTSKNYLEYKSQTSRIVNDNYPIGASSNVVYADDYQSLPTQVNQNACRRGPYTSGVSQSQKIQAANNSYQNRDVVYSAERQPNTENGKNHLPETGEIYVNEHKRHFGTNTQPNSEQTEFYCASSDDVREYMAALPEEWKNVWYRVYDRQTSFLTKYTAFYQENF